MEPSGPTPPTRRPRLHVATGLSLGILLLASAGWLRWRAITTECRALCTPDRALGMLTLRTGASLPLLRRDLWRGSLNIEYLTQLEMGDRVGLCSQARDALQALETGAELVGVERLDLEPTDSRLRVLGWKWSGPVVTCCMSTFVTFERNAQGQWGMPSGCCPP